jgi:hypothetical protein
VRYRAGKVVLLAGVGRDHPRHRRARPACRPRGMHPGAYGLLYYSMGGELFSNEDRVVRAAPRAGGLGAIEGSHQAAVALDQGDLRTPLEDPAESYLLDLITPFRVLDSRHRLPPLFPFSGFRPMAEPVNFSPASYKESFVRNRSGTRDPAPPCCLLLSALVAALSSDSFTESRL